MPKLTDSEMTTFEDLSFELDAKVRKDYSGRFMYGKQCLGYVGRLDVEEVKEQLVDELGETGEAMAESATTDSMGLDIIIYFPGFQVPEGWDGDPEAYDE